MIKAFRPPYPAPVGGAVKGFDESWRIGSVVEMHLGDLVRQLNHPIPVFRLVVFVNQPVQLENSDSLQIIGLWFNDFCRG